MLVTSKKLKYAAVRVALDPRDIMDLITTDVWSDPAREGEFAGSPGEVISTLQKYLSLKYAKDIAYRNFSDRIKGPWRDALVKHWYEHAGHERDHQYAVAMKIVALGGDPGVPIQQVTQVPPNIEAFFQSMMDLELDAISMGREIITAAGENVGLRIMIENMIEKDSHHLDDLRRMFGEL